MQSIAVPLQLPVVPEEVIRLSPLLLLGSGAIEAAHGLIGRLISRSRRVIVADSANSFDAYSLVREAPRHMAPTLLNNVRLSRAFTWQQQLVLLERRIAAEAARQNTRWVVILGPLDLLADNDVKPWQAALAADRTAEAFRRLGEKRMTVIAAQRNRPLERGKRSGLLDRLTIVCNRVLVERNELPQKGDGQVE